MSNEQTNKTDTAGNEDTESPENGQENLSELNKLKASNDVLEKELVRGRELRAESQKLEAEKMIGGQSNAGQETKNESPEDKKKAQASEFFKGTALGEAIDKTK